MDSSEVSEEEIDDPFLTFPEEIWEAILGHCDSTEDIHNVTLVYPQLAHLSNGKQFSWLIADIIPILFPKLVDFNEIKVCRLVSKRWKNGVNKALEIHPDRLPYKSSRQASITETHFSYHPLPYITTNILKFLWCGRDHYTKSMAGDNPFPGRSVHVTLNYRYDNKYENLYFKRPRRSSFRLRKGKEQQSQVLSLLETFGHHIWYITFKLPDLRYWTNELCISELVRTLIHCLFHLPNLKSLKLETFGEVDTNVITEDANKKIVDAIDGSRIPAQLEALDLCNFGGTNVPKDMFNSFIKCFVNHEHVKKLTIFVGHWHKEMANIFPNLSELCLKESFHFSEDKEIGYSLKRILKMLSFPSLRKLRITAYEMNIIVMLQILSKQRIESLELNGEYYTDHERTKHHSSGSVKNRLHKSLSMLLKSSKIFKGRLSESRSRHDVPSITNLKLNTMVHLNFRFLKNMSCLKFLTITVDEDMCNRFQFQLTDTTDLVSVCVHYVCSPKVDEVGAASLKELWNAYPKLMMFTVEHDDDMFQSVRECGNQIFMSTSKDMSGDSSSSSSSIVA